MGGAIPGLMVLGSISKQTEQARGSKPVSSTPLWPLHQLLPPVLPCLSSYPDFFGDEQQCGSVSQINLFLPNLLFGHGVSSEQ